MYPKNNDSTKAAREGVNPSPSFPAVEEGILAFWKGDDTLLYVKDFGGDENFHVVAVDVNQRDVMTARSRRAGRPAASSRACSASAARRALPVWLP